MSNRNVKYVNKVNNNNNTEWYNNRIQGLNSKFYVAKPFDLKADNPKGDVVTCCANELVVYRYINARNMQNLSQYDSIDPPELNEVINSIDPADIRKNFYAVRDIVIKKINELGLGEVKILINAGIPATNELNRISHKYSNNSQRIEQYIRKMFEIISAAHSVGLCIADIKPDNIMFSEADGDFQIFFIDFDTSFVVKPRSSKIKMKDHKFTFDFASPEFAKIKTNIGLETDVFQAGIVAYQLLNNYCFPEHNIDDAKQWGNILVEYEDNENGKIHSLKEVFDKMTKNNEVFMPPKNGSDELKEAVVAALTIDAKKRPTADEFLEILNGNSKTRHKFKKIKKNKKVKKTINIKIGKIIIRIDATGLIIILALVIILAFIYFFMSPLIKINTSPDNAGNNFNSNGSVTEEATSNYITTEVSTLSLTTEIVTELSTDIISTTVMTADTSITETPKVTVTSTDSPDNRTGSDAINSKSDVDLPITGENPESQTVVTTVTDISENKPVIVTTQAVVQPPQPQEVTSPFTYSIETIVNEEIYGSVTGVVITGYKNYSQLPKNLEIPSEIDGTAVVAIADDAFNGTDITVLTIPESVYEIGNRSFKNCPYLYEINISESVCMIGEEAFYFTVDDTDKQREIHVISSDISRYWKFRDKFGNHWNGKSDAAYEESYYC